MASERISLVAYADEGIYTAYRNPAKAYKDAFGLISGLDNDNIASIFDYFVNADVSDIDDVDTFLKLREEFPEADGAGIAKILAEQGRYEEGVSLYFEYLPFECPPLIEVTTIWLHDD